MDIKRGYDAIGAKTLPAGASRESRAMLMFF